MARRVGGGGPLRYEVRCAYAAAVVAAGGVPVMLPHEVELADDYVERCDGLLLTGGGDPTTEAFGEPTHPLADRIDPRRQAFELALLEAAEAGDTPVLGVCLGMQLMALHAGGRAAPAPARCAAHRCRPHRRPVAPDPPPPRTPTAYRKTRGRPRRYMSCRITTKRSPTRGGCGCSPPPRTR